MGSIEEGAAIAEDRIEGLEDTTVYVAVGKNAEKSQKLLHWTTQNFPGRRICLLHIHLPDPENSSSESLFNSRTFKIIKTVIFVSVACGVSLLIKCLTKVAFLVKTLLVI